MNQAFDDERHPYVPHGNISKWKKWLEYMNTLNVETVVPGHGDIGNNELIGNMKNYLMDLEITAQALIDENRSIDDIELFSPPKKYNEWWFDRFYEPNLRFSYESIEPG